MSLATTLINADESTARDVLAMVKQAGLSRLEEEVRQSKLALAAGSTKASDTEIITAWGDWYVAALATVVDMVDAEGQIAAEISSAQEAIAEKTTACIDEI